MFRRCNWSEDVVLVAVDVFSFAVLLSDFFLFGAFES